MTIDLNTLPKHSITVKETTLTDGEVKFLGAYRYDGYSLYDILDSVVLKKKNEAEFPPIIDLYVEVSNEQGRERDILMGRDLLPGQPSPYPDCHIGCPDSAIKKQGPVAAAAKRPGLLPAMTWLLPGISAIPCGSR